MYFPDNKDQETRYTMRQAAKLISIKGYGRNNLYKFLREKKIIINKYEPAQKYIDQGYFIYDTRPVDNGYGKLLDWVPVAYVTPKGIQFIKKLIINHLNPTNHG